jgi:hypothetical protein
MTPRDVVRRAASPTHVSQLQESVMNDQLPSPLDHWDDDARLDAVSFVVATALNASVTRRCERRCVIDAARRRAIRPSA